MSTTSWFRTWQPPADSANRSCTVRPKMSGFCCTWEISLSRMSLNRGAGSRGRCRGTSWHFRSSAEANSYRFLRNGMQCRRIRLVEGLSWTYKVVECSPACPPHVPSHESRRSSDAPCTCKPKEMTAVVLKSIWCEVCCSPPDLPPNAQYACLWIWGLAIPREQHGHLLWRMIWIHQWGGTVQASLQRFHCWVVAVNCPGHPKQPRQMILQIRNKSNTKSVVVCCKVNSKFGWRN